MNKLFLLCILTGCSMLTFGQNIAIKNNLLYDATLTPNLGIEIAMSNKSTFNLFGGYHPFEFKEYKRIKHWVVQPEYRYWFCEKFNGNFAGVHLLGGEYSVAGIKLPFGLLPALKHHKYEGFFAGGGVALGHHWTLGNYWSIEATLGVGYIYTEADKYPCAECGEKLETSSHNYFGPTKAALSLIFFIR